MRVVHTDVTGQIVEYFKDNILSGEWKVGEKIPSENQLTQMLGVSRASVRTAIQQLVGIGVLESIHGKGTFLIDDQMEEADSRESKITAQDCLDIEKVLEYRRVIESEICYMATQRATPELLAELSRLLERMKEHEGEREAFVAADVKFHKAICAACGNPLLEKSMNKVFEETRKNHRQMNEIFGYQDGIRYHTLILDAMKSGDSDRTRELMREHLQNAIDRLQES